jgi:hypothetical protein
MAVNAEHNAHCQGEKFLPFSLNVAVRTHFQSGGYASLAHVVFRQQLVGKVAWHFL